MSDYQASVIRDPHAMPAHALSAALSAGRLTSTALVESLLERIARYDAKLHAFIAVYATEARAAPGTPSVPCTAFPSRSKTSSTSKAA